MSRTKRLVAVMTPVQADHHATGMFGEPVQLGKWESPPDSLLGACIVREVVQIEPWSSGVMIFTCLEAEFGNGQKTTLCQWVQCPTEGHFNAEDGVYWV
jgi:hypothetical protein